MARVIRAGAVRLPALVLDARERSAAILAKAQADAEALVAEARSKMEALEREARERNAADLDALAAALEVRAARARAEAIAQAERDVVALVTTIAERVLDAVIEDAPERIVPAVRAQLERVKRAKDVEIRVHPLDAVTLRRALGTDGDAAPRIHEDASIRRGGCIVSSEFGILDARVEVQLAAFARALSSAP